MRDVSPSSVDVTEITGLPLLSGQTAILVERSLYDGAPNKAGCFPFFKPSHALANITFSATKTRGSPLTGPKTAPDTA